MLFMHFLFRDEEELKYNDSYSNKINRASVIEVVKSNRSKVESYATIIEDAFKRLIVDHANIDPFWHQENDETYDHLNNELFSSNVETNDVETEIWPDSKRVRFGISKVPIFSDNMINKNIRSLNDKQSQVFDIVHKWSRDYMKNLNSRVLKKVTPFFYFSYWRWRSKSYLIQTIHMSLTKAYV